MVIYQEDAVYKKKQPANPRWRKTEGLPWTTAKALMEQVLPLLDGARQAQADHYQALARGYCAQMLEGTAADGGIQHWTHVEPASPALETWTGATRWWGVEQLYRMACDREGDLRSGRGPYYCRTCEERPGNGWRAHNCMDCDWAATGADIALKRSRDFGQRLQCPRCPEKVWPGILAQQHLATHANVA